VRLKKKQVGSHSSGFGKQWTRRFLAAKAVDERRSLAASDLSGRFDVNCCVNSITTGKAAVPVDEFTPDVLTASVDEVSNELALEPAQNNHLKSLVYRRIAPRSSFGPAPSVSRQQSCDGSD
jgi:hypothetical protein